MPTWRRSQVASAAVCAVACLLYVAATGSVAQAATFAPAANFPAGTQPESVAIGDFNGDAKPDLAVTNDKVSVLFGNGNGTFAAATSYPAGLIPASVAVGDFNGDARPDLAVANDGDGSVSVLLNNGNGTFGTASHYVAGTAPASPVIADFNGDGDADLAVGHRVQSTEVTVFLGNGDGTLSAGVDFAADLDPRSLAVGDFNGDGRPDLATANFNANTASVLLGNGNGTFGAATHFATGTNTFPISVAVGDFNGDNDSDLATANFFTGNVSVLLGGAGGGFGAATQFAVGTTPVSVAVADLDGDGDPELATANRDSANVSVLEGGAGGSFDAAAHFAVGTQPFSVAAADFNSDGKRDLVAANRGSNTVSVLLNTTSSPPAATTDPATALTNTGATLHSTIDPNGSATTYRYEYGRTTSFGTVVGDFSAGAGTTALSQPGTAITGLSPATTYYYRVAAFNAAPGQARGAVVAFTTTGAPTAPTATTAAATTIANTGATLNGTMNAHGAATAYAFEWGTTTSFGNLTPPQNGGSTTADLAVSAGLSGLGPNQTYFYRLVATNAQGTTRGPVMAFTTTGPSTPPAVSTGAASQITSTGARLSGTVNPRARATTFTFEYGTTTSFGNISAVDNAGSGATTLNVSLPVTGLSPGTTYLYRLVASNAAGTTSGPLQSFTTATT